MRLVRKKEIRSLSLINYIMYIKEKGLIITLAYLENLEKDFVISQTRDSDVEIKIDLETIRNVIKLFKKKHERS